MATATTIRLWDWPVRLSHWLFAALVPALWLSAESGKLDLHKQLGLVMLAVVAFRLGWGLVGSAPARFASATLTAGVRCQAPSAPTNLIKHHALDYLLKPVDKDELKSAVRKAVLQPQDPDLLGKVGALIQQMRNPSPVRRIAIPTREGLEMVDVERIMHARADDNYTELHLDGGRRIVISRTLKDVEMDLPKDRFMRVHSGHLVALPFVIRYIRGNGGYVVLPNGEQLPVSRAKKDELMERLGGL